MKPILLALFISISCYFIYASAPSSSFVSTNLSDKTKSLFDPQPNDVSVYAAYLPLPSAAVNTINTNKEETNNLWQNPKQFLNNFNQLFVNDLTSQIGVGVKVEF